MAFSPFEINYGLCESGCLGNQTCSIKFDVSNPRISITTLPGGSTVNAESLVNSSPFDQSFDVWDEVSENCQINKYFLQVLSEAKVPMLLSTLPELSGMSRAAVRRSIKALVEQEKIKLAESRGPHGRTAITVALT